MAGSVNSQQIYCRAICWSSCGHFSSLSSPCIDCSIGQLTEVLLQAHLLVQLLVRTRMHQMMLTMPALQLHQSPSWEEPTTVICTSTLSWKVTKILVSRQAHNPLEELTSSLLPVCQRLSLPGASGHEWSTEMQRSLRPVT